MTSREEGFTLVELLLAIVILGVVIVPMTNAIVLGLRTTDATDDRILESQDQYLLTAYFPNDVAAAATLTTATSTCAPVAAVVELAWTEESLIDNGTAFVTSYYVDGSSGQLRRRACTSGSATSDVPVASALAATAPVLSQSGREVTLTVTQASGRTYATSGHRRVS